MVLRAPIYIRNLLEKSIIKKKKIRKTCIDGFESTKLYKKFVREELIKKMRKTTITSFNIRK
jgi:hypothetical protein